MKSFKYYVNLDTAEDKLRILLKTYRFGTVANVLARVPSFQEYELANGDIRPASAVTAVGEHGVAVEAHR